MKVKMFESGVVSLVVAVALVFLACQGWVACQTTNPPGVVSLTGTGTGVTQQQYIVVDTNGVAIVPSGPITIPTLFSTTFAATTAGFTTVSGTLIKMSTNSIAAWPTAPGVRGQCSLINSNGSLYVLISGPNSAVWTATNKIAGP